MLLHENDKRWTQTQLVVFFVLFLLAVPEFNPIQMLYHTFSTLQPWQVGSFCLLMMVTIFLSDAPHLLYVAIRIFFHSILSIFFDKVEIIGAYQNIPPQGPVIFCINHANQFMDAVMVLCTLRNHRPISYLMAEASWKRRIIGDFARALQVIPVKRAQDEARKGNGRVELVLEKNQEQDEQQQDKDDNQSITQQLTLQGHQGTQFTQHTKVGDKIRLEGMAYAAKIVHIESDTCLHLAWDSPTTPPLHTRLQYDILPQVPLQVVFEKVLDRLALQGAVGIFPEGGSHDRTDLLPLKIGISLLAYQALDTHGLRVPIIPVGLSYFHAHRWRGRAVVEYGKPVYVDPSTLPQFQQGGAARHHVCQAFLSQVEDAMRSVLVQSPDYETLQLLHTARRLYQRPEQLLTQEKQDLARRFTVGYQRFVQQMAEHPDAMPPEWMDLQRRLKEYANELKELGLKDYQVNMLVASEDEEKESSTLYVGLQWLYAVVHLVVLLMIAAVPTLLLNLPVGVLAGLYSERRRQKALQKSKVKVHGYDVMLTEKVVFCMVMVPTLWFIYFLILRFGTNLEGPTVSLIMLSLPVFSYIGIIVAKAGMVGWNDLRPHLMRLFPTTRPRLKALPATREALQKDLRAFIKRIGPELGDLYYEKEVDWAAVQEKYRRSKEESSVAEMPLDKKEQ
ncbi:glycerol-3-phosphate O-acyltransferase / dihydroxyacetone phosphate acyltransferase [Fistulifera solaris]|uniref:Glycerol-3-phosphate O-acyltransferase / dihydroxyacetone phosphate acyltransferase n=1 Tax=Fistulifera solaris TaxID=1519565 RepID=A0A1Z5JWH4_FISSO|nr:glycerol-3-phosphate O-acyltransferase / dihydroxyacetone phosphate acyltransferase [Fistulifera solaris]|eukprot:GAX18374.1 glycerol-3-phosphate O-acyltransferase / dihydroxyacetone phosphate acyltransferase [Fistulifera solaris]